MVVSQYFKKQMQELQGHPGASWDPVSKEQQQNLQNNLALYKEATNGLVLIFI